MSSGSVFYDVGKLDQIAINLFYGWGYNFYRAENQVRHDDLMVREKVGWLLGLSRDIVEQQMSAYRKKFLRITRDKPLPDPEAVDAAGLLESLSAGIGKVESTIRTLPVPETDRMTQRYRQELPTLATLREYDTHLVGRAQLLFETLTGKDSSWILTNDRLLREALTLMTDDIHQRQAVLKNL